MDIEQRLPKKPNFLLIVILFAVSILVLLALGVWVLHKRAGHTLPDGQSRNDQKVLPSVLVSGT